MKTIFRFFAERHLLSNLLTIMVLLLGVFPAALMLAVKPRNPAERCLTYMEPLCWQRWTSTFC
jgi:hypothetical protein